MLAFSVAELETRTAGQRPQLTWNGYRHRLFLECPGSNGNRGMTCGTGLHGAGVSTAMSTSMAAGAVSISIGNGQDLTVELDRGVLTSMNEQRGGGGGGLFCLSDSWRCGVAPQGSLNANLVDDRLVEAVLLVLITSFCSCCRGKYHHRHRHHHHHHHHHIGLVEAWTLVPPLKTSHVLHRLGRTALLMTRRSEDP